MIISINKNILLNVVLLGKKQNNSLWIGFLQNYPQDTLIETHYIGSGYDFEVDGSVDVIEVKGLSYNAIYRKNGRFLV